MQCGNLIRKKTICNSIMLVSLRTKCGNLIRKKIVFCSPLASSHIIILSGWLLSESACSSSSFSESRFDSPFYILINPPLSTDFRVFSSLLLHPGFVCSSFDVFSALKTGLIENVLHCFLDTPMILFTAQWWPLLNSYCRGLTVMERQGVRKISPLKSSPTRSYSNRCISTKVVYIRFGKGSGDNEHTF